MLFSTKKIIDEYYCNNISSQKLIAYLKANEHSSNEEVYKEYHNITNICKRCNSVMNYSGFKNGYRCSKKCSNKRKIKAKAEKEELNSELILKNITKQNNVSFKFLTYYGVTTKQCYDIVFTSKKCNFCENEAKFINWSKGYSTKCDSSYCSKTQRKIKTAKTNLEKYGCENVSQNKEIQKKKLITFKNNFGVDNISQLKKIQIKIRKSMEFKNRWVRLADKTDYSIYFKASSFKHGFEFTKYTSEREKELLYKYGIYNNKTNKNGCVRDHLLSRKYGFENNIPTWIISHPANCEIVLHTENISRANRKEGDNLISLEELLNKI